MENPWIAAARFLGIGWFIVMCIVGGVFGGRWVGQQLNNEIAFTFVGLALGVLVAGYGIYQSYSLLKKSEGKEKEEK